jgi:hypothetical protein
MGLYLEQQSGTLQESVTQASTDPCLPTVKESHMDQGTNNDAALANSPKSPTKLDNKKANVLERRDGDNEQEVRTSPED